jgi:hypothetical protein
VLRSLRAPASARHSQQLITLIALQEFYEVVTQAPPYVAPPRPRRSRERLLRLDHGSNHDRRRGYLTAPDLPALCLTVRTRSTGVPRAGDLAVAGLGAATAARGELREPATYVLLVPVLRPE